MQTYTYTACLHGDIKVSCTLFSPDACLLQAVTPISPALPAWGVLLSAGQAGRVDAFLKRAHKWGFSKNVVTFNELLFKSSSSLFQKMQSPAHCLNSLLPPKKKTDYKLRNRHCSYTLPQCNFNIFKHSFVNWCLFTL